MVKIPWPFDEQFWTHWECFVFCLYHNHGATIQCGVFPKHSRTVCMHYLHILAKLLVRFFLSVTGAVYNIFCKHWVFSKYDMNCIAHWSEKLICAQNTCNSSINKFCEFSFLKWIAFVLTPICSQFIRFQNAEHAWVMDRCTVKININDCTL